MVRPALVLRQPRHVEKHHVHMEFYEQHKHLLVVMTTQVRKCMSINDYSHDSLFCVVSSENMKPKVREEKLSFLNNR